MAAVEVAASEIMNIPLVAGHTTIADPLFAAVEVDADGILEEAAVVAVRTAIAAFAATVDVDEDGIFEALVVVGHIVIAVLFVAVEVATDVDGRIGFPASAVDTAMLASLQMILADQTGAVTILVFELAICQMHQNRSIHPEVYPRRESRKSMSWTIPS